MQLQETLTRENFWERMFEKYPNATKNFCIWIDEYKKAVGWNSLFNSDALKYIEGPPLNYEKVNAPKFHEIPHAMQVGIWLEYVCQRGGCQFKIDDFFKYDLASDIEGMFENLLEEEARFELEDVL